MPFEKELLQAKLYKFLIDPSIFLLPRYVMRMFRQIFGISLRKGSLGDGLAALSENGLFVEFKLCSANKLPQRITEAADSSETFFICVYDFPPETIRKLRSGRLKITMEEGKYGYIFDLARRELYKLTKNKKVTLDLLNLLPERIWGGRTDNVMLPTADIVYSERNSGVNENNKEAGNGLHDLLPAMSWGDGLTT